MPRQPVIDGFEFASAGTARQGSLRLSEFPRLRELLASDLGEVAYLLEGTRDEYGRPGLRLAVRGVLQLRCQRCLEAMAYEIDAGGTLVLAATLAEIDADPADASGPDRVLAGNAMPVRDLIEDELILGLPYAPRHEACAAAAKAGEERAASPFTGLRGLMRGKH